MSDARTPHKPAFRAAEATRKVMSKPITETQLETPALLHRELAVAIADEEAHRLLPLGERHHQVASLLGDKTLVRIRGHATEVDAAARQLDEEQHVQTPQPNGVDGEKVTGDDRGRLRAQEL